MQTGPVGKMARVVHTRLSISWGAMSIALTDLHGHVSPDAPVLELWGIHVWEPDPPLRSEGQRPLPKQKHGRRMGKQAPQEERVEPVEWFLQCSLPTTCATEAWRRAEWYGYRWGVEDFHKGVKTGYAWKPAGSATRPGCNASWLWPQPSPCACSSDAN